MISFSELCKIFTGCVSHFHLKSQLYETQFSTRCEREGMGIEIEVHVRINRCGIKGTSTNKVDASRN